MSGALTQASDTIVLYTDEGVAEHDSSGLNYTYRYRVRALQNTPCPSGAFSATADFPPPCTFTGTIVVQTGASSGDGLTPASAWVMNGGDSLEVVPPGGTVLTSTTMQVSDPSGTLIDTQIDVTDPVVFNWGNQTPSTVYAVTFTMVNDAAPPCTEQIIRYVQQEPLPACSIRTFTDDASMLVNTGTKYQLQLTLTNEGAENLTIKALNFDWTAPTKITWNSIKFPSAAGATMTGPGTTDGAVVFDLDPKPGQLSASDVTVNGDNGTRVILINMAEVNGNPVNITPSVINSLCVEYTVPSQTSFTFRCQVLPDADVDNPNSCN